MRDTSSKELVVRPESPGPWETGRSDRQGLGRRQDQKKPQEPCMGAQQMPLPESAGLLGKTRKIPD